MREPLRARTVARHTIVQADRQSMYELFESVYDDVCPQRFASDLDSKNHVIVLRDRGGSIRGFSTLLRTSVNLDGSCHQVVYSGDTVIHPEYWGGSALGKAFLAYLFRTALHKPTTPLWWFLISKGYKTYLLMANNFFEHWPRYEAHTPHVPQQLMHTLSQQMFGDAYRPDDGVVRFDVPHGRLRNGVAEIDAELAASHPRIGHFAHRNPGWRHGDELVCLARMRWTMPLRYAWKKRAP